MVGAGLSQWWHGPPGQLPLLRIPPNPTTRSDGIRPPSSSPPSAPSNPAARRRATVSSLLLGDLWFICLPERGGGRQLSERWSADVGTGGRLAPEYARCSGFLPVAFLVTGWTGSAGVASRAAAKRPEGSGEFPLSREE